MARTQILATVPGVFYRRPAPNSPPFKAAGDLVNTGDIIGLVEVMKTFLEVRAEGRGKFVDYVVDDEAEVMSGDVVCELED